MLRLTTLLFVLCTYGYVLTNLLAAHLPAYSLVFVALRDSWVVVFLALLAFRRDGTCIVLLGALAFFGVLGAAPLASGGSSFTDILVYFYGLRDLIFLALLYFFLRADAPLASQRQVGIFVGLVAGLFTFQVVLQLAGLDKIVESVFNTSAYYAGKGVDINLGGGLFGQRPGAPLYSPALVATLLGSFVLAWRPVRGRWLLAALSTLTLSKVIVYFVFMRLFRRLYVLLILAAIVAIPLILYGTSYVKERYPNTIYSFHAHSISEHVGFAQYFHDDDLSGLPDLLGSSSVAAHVLRGEDPHRAPESLLLARVMDFNLWGLVLVALLVWGYATLDARARFIFATLMGLQLLTGMSNHPVALVPLLALLQARGDRQVTFSIPPTVPWGLALNVGERGVRR